MSALIEPGCGDRHRPEVVRGHAEVVLRRVMAAGQVAQAVWRLLQVDRSRHRVAELELGGWRRGVLPELAADAARQRIDFCRRHEQAPQVYAIAAHAAADSAADADLAGLALADLASLHLRLGYPADCYRLVDLAATDSDLSEHARRVLATVRAWAADYQQRVHNIDRHDDGEEGQVR